MNTTPLFKSGLKQKILVVTGVLMLAIIVILASLAIIFLNAEYDRAITFTEDDFDNNIRVAVEALIGALRANHQRYLNGEISEQAAIDTAKIIVRDARYTSGAPGEVNDGYFWADMSDGLCAVHYNQANEGTMRWNAQDQEGTYFIQKFISLGNEGGGWSDFYFGKPGDESGSHKKRGYTEKFEPYGWYISTGNYYEDTAKTIGGIQAKQFRDIAIMIGASLLILAIGMIILARNVNDIVKIIRNLVENIENSSHKINAEIAVLSDASERLADGSSRQAASIEETSATMNETSSMVAQTAENTSVASKIADESEQAITDAGKYMGELMQTMTELKESSDKVSKIVKTIDDIAFQTNLLAINATVEAARAGGDAGRSFAVVAQEVRSLAQKSAQNSAETAEIIEKNITLTNSSKDASEKVLELTEKSAKQIIDLGKLIAEIHTASQEQTSGVKQINAAVGQMEKVTQENAAVAEENSAASRSMQDEIANLEDSVSVARELVR